MTLYRIATITGAAPGAGAAVDSALVMLRRLGLDIEVDPQDLGEARYLSSGQPLPAEALASLRQAHAVFCGSPPSSSNPAVPVGTLERGLLFALRRELRLAINVRRFTDVRPGRSQTITVVRENSEGAYFSEGTVVNPGSPAETSVELLTTSFAAVERCMRYAVGLAAPGGSVAVAHKTHVLVASGRIWERVARALNAEFPGVRMTIENVDTLCARLVDDPSRYDVIVSDNVFGDIVSDVAGAVLGAVEHSGSAELSSLPDGPSLFEPIHGPQDGTAREVSALAALDAAALLATRLGERAVGGALARAVLATAASTAAPATRDAVLEEVGARAESLLAGDAAEVAR